MHNRFVNGSKNKMVKAHRDKSKVVKEVCFEDIVNCSKIMTITVKKSFVLIQLIGDSPKEQTEVLRPSYRHR